MSDEEELKCPDRRHHDSQVKQIIHETVPKAMDTFFSTCGVDTKHLQEVQADFLFLRKYRKFIEQITGKLFLFIITAIVLGTVAIYKGFL